VAGLAACLTVDPELFFPYSFQTDVIRQTKAVCATCPVTAERLNFAVLIGADAGILGGATAEERRSPATVNKVASPKPKRTSGADTEAAILSSLSAYLDMSTQQLAAAVSFEVATITEAIPGRTRPIMLRPVPHRPAPPRQRNGPSDAPCRARPVPPGSRWAYTRRRPGQVPTHAHARTGRGTASLRIPHQVPTIK